MAIVPDLAGVSPLDKTIAHEVDLNFYQGRFEIDINRKKYRSRVFENIPTLNISTSSGFAVAKDGSLRKKAVNKARWMPGVGLLVEEGAVNYLTNSLMTDGFDHNNAAATFSQRTINARRPDGTWGPVREVTITSVGHIRFGDLTSGTATTNYAGSVYIKSGDGTSHSAFVDVNDVSGNAKVFKNDWVRLSAIGSHATAPYRFVDVNFLELGVFLLYGIQLETNFSVEGIPSSLMETGAVPSGRNLDDISIPLTPLQALTFYTESISLTTLTNRSIAALNDNSAGNRIDFRNSGTDQLLFVDAGNVYQFGGSGNTLGLGAVRKAAISIQQGLAIHAGNGKIIRSGPVATMPNYNRLRIGTLDNGILPTCGYIRRIRVIPRAMSSDELIKLTA